MKGVAEELQSSVDLRKDSYIYNRVLFGTIAAERFNRLKALIRKGRICLRSVICGIVMLCTKPNIQNFDGNIRFSIGVDMKPIVDDSSQFGILKKNIIVDCPLKLIDDKHYKDTDSESIKNGDILEIQFRKVTDFVTEELSNKLQSMAKHFKRNNCPFNFSSINSQISDSKVIQINDLTDIPFTTTEQNPNGYSFHDLKVTEGLSPNESMSLSYITNSNSAMSISIHYTETKYMDSFVECFRTFIEN
ncbi:hypothetical protein Kpol_1032p1 [Vanderwaltozyma polyspora DSM 70294]|uniref:Uncharacterized protein n=1 Tax=Vanderwaltozyma polyspora (strain ATCC 22028 / DSM 70294 / BCRC 21397 / CBS 2163 / NBRC 10782 / NRRL Y-8283 / UCD 57-17) TaxID=436907 RepID=A7TGV7_VANPO|nr:uncharacterized protein Kpol_1032p1 [Vanderwaltozyma polyspora DSM 70294]EDO18409.1 hypothetical protein Kpol_1032p1 [Vanderwaltozyma polyspora DSM 70294]